MKSKRKVSKILSSYGKRLGREFKSSKLAKAACGKRVRI